MAPSASVAEYYTGKAVFITGATGFMGKVLVEKLLRSCPDVAVIYVLMRAKKGQSPSERLEDFLNCLIFDKIRDEHPKRLEKVHFISGDILKNNLAMSAEDRALLMKTCHVVFHCAACVRFDQYIRDAVNMNTGGTQKVLDLVEKMENLEVYTHVSTAYCRCELPVLEETLYPAPHKANHVMAAVDWMDDELLTHLEPKMIAPQPNTYAYTKALTEDLVAEYEGKFPIAIARPSIVTASWKEPIPGWVDNMNGPTGLVVGAGKGVIRSMLCEDSYHADAIPVDVVVNGCILLARQTALDRPSKIQVFNVTQSSVNPITWKEALEMGRLHVTEFPFTTVLWYPGGSPKTSRVLHFLAHIFLHLLPAYFIDLLLFLTGKEPFMVRVQKRISSGLKVLQYYTTKEWYFRNENFIALRSRVTPEDDEEFFTDMTNMDWNQYMRSYVRGAREYCCKEDPATLPTARKWMKKLYYLDRTMQVVFYCICSWLIYSYVHIFSPLLDIASSSLTRLSPITRALAEEI